ncbi:M48 family metallopeptidase [Maridesulfovibrio frigidus]|uniref:M48 family metallopeptidase n=1 Tax=Maridesulfovibrio frigidus TaxID=340956 RepID=UPI0004E0FEBE|nr:SprT family zinc-dependent metalloprotease [Maridesulfovibrio frigidus]
MADFPPPYSVRISARAKNVIIKLIPDKGLEIVLPKGVSESKVPGFLEKRREWILSATKQLEEKGFSLTPPKLILPDSLIFVASEMVIFIRRTRTRKSGLRVRKNVDKLMLSGADWTVQEDIAALTKFVRGQARAFLSAELAKISKELGMPYKRLFIRSQRKRWGSCSSNGNINLNMKLMFLPYRLVRYVLIHELCHTVHLNHSGKYWQLVKQVEPDFQALEKELGAASPLVPGWINF